MQLLDDVEFMGYEEGYLEAKNEFIKFYEELLRKIGKENINQLPDEVKK